MSRALAGGQAVIPFGWDPGFSKQHRKVKYEEEQDLLGFIMIAKRPSESWTEQQKICYRTKLSYIPDRAIQKQDGETQFIANPSRYKGMFTNYVS